MAAVARLVVTVPDTFDHVEPPSRLTATLRPRSQKPEGSPQVFDRFFSDQPHVTYRAAGAEGFFGSAGATAIRPITKMSHPAVACQEQAAGSNPPCTRIRYGSANEPDAVLVPGRSRR